MRIAAALSAGRSMAAIARVEGVSWQTIWKQAGPADARQIVVAMVDGERERIYEMFARTLQVIEEALGAKMVRSARDGKPIGLGPDHSSRLAAVSRFLKVLTLGRPVPRAANPGSARGSRRRMGIAGALIRGQNLATIARSRGVSRHSRSGQRRDGENRPDVRPSPSGDRGGARRDGDARERGRQAD